MTANAKAIVVGAGIGGLAAAAALSPHFRDVLVIDRDSLENGPSVRLGTAQGAHTHQLLKAGEQALERLLPGITADFVAAGAVSMTVGHDVKVYDFGGWIDDCDAGFSVTSLSRPVYENILRRRVERLPNVTLRGDTFVRRFAIENGRCVGIEREDGIVERADLVIDSSGVSAPLIQQLEADGHAEFATEHVRINVAYTTARFRKPPEWRDDHLGFFILPAPPENHFGLLLPIEDDQWMLSLGRRGGDTPPRDAAGFKAYARRLVEPHIFERIKDAEFVGELRTFRKPLATRRHVWDAAKWPECLIPMGDAISSVNPTYGQGMTVAVCQAEALHFLLARRQPLERLGPAYLPLAGDISGQAWSLSINSDYVYPQTEGPRPERFAMSRALASTLRKLADEDTEFRVMRYRLVHMLETAEGMLQGPLGIRFFTALQGSMAS